MTSAPIDLRGPFLWNDPDAVSSVDGPLAGTRVAVKDLVRLAGHPTTAGTSFARWPVATEDAPVVAALRAAGAHVVGATRLHELACGVTGLNRSQGTVRNPAAPERAPGGSSSGSAAAVAAGLADLAVGTDTGGSVRIPSACCGVVGYKPARGVLPLDGVVPCAPTLDHVGLHARSVELIDRAMSALTGESSADPSIERLGVARAELDAAEEPVRDAVTAAIERLDLPTVDVALPDAATVAEATTTVLFAEFARVNADLTAEQRSLLGDDIRGRLEAGEAIDAGTHEGALARLDEIRSHVDRLLGEVDAIVLPTLPILPPTLEQADAEPIATAQALVRFTRLANASGHPAITVPLDAALPVGLQVIGPQPAVFAVARAVTQE
ncbi:MAG: amidase [Actinomycetota bacterium]